MKEKKELFMQLSKHTSRLKIWSETIIEKTTYAQALGIVAHLDNLVRSELNQLKGTMEDRIQIEGFLGNCK